MEVYLAVQHANVVIFIKVKFTFMADFLNKPNAVYSKAVKLMNLKVWKYLLHLDCTRILRSLFIYVK